MLSCLPWKLSVMPSTFRLSWYTSARNAISYCRLPVNSYTSMYSLSEMLSRYTFLLSLGSMVSFVSGGREIMDPASRILRMIFSESRFRVFCWSEILSTSLSPSSWPYTLVFFCKISGKQLGL